MKYIFSSGGAGWGECVGGWEMVRGCNIYLVGVADVTGVGGWAGVRGCSIGVMLDINALYHGSLLTVAKTHYAIACGVQPTPSRIWELISE